MNILVFGNGSLSHADQEYKISLEFAELGHKVYLLRNKAKRFFDAGELKKHKNLTAVEMAYQEYRYDNIDLEFKPDICLGMDQSVSPFVAEYQDKTNIPGYCIFLDLPIHVIDGKDAVNYNPSYSQRFYYWINCALGLTGIIFNHEFTASEFTKRYKRKAHHVFYAVSNDNAWEENKEENGDPTNDFVFGCSRIIPYKRIDLACQAIKRTPYTYKHVFVNGDKDEIAKVEAIASSSTNKFVLYKSIPEAQKMSFYYNAKLTVYSQMTQWLGGLSPIEGMSVKTPGVCFDYPILRELYQDCVLYVKPGSIIQLREAITELYEDEDLNADLAEKGYNRFKQYFTRKVMAENILEIIQNGKF